MPIYDYRCTVCKHEFDVVKSMKESDTEEYCPKCDHDAVKMLPKRIYFTGASDWDTAHYSPAFGREFRNNKELRQYAKDRGYEEVGNESISKDVDEKEKERERKREKEWDKL